MKLFIRSVMEFGILTIKDYMNLHEESSSNKLQKFAAMVSSD